LPSSIASAADKAMETELAKDAKRRQARRQQSRRYS
jgi:hypothetical protein